ncbi:MAG: hypothetical protein H0T11_02105, partial [Chthoniobacterales bacterium]|nr:hypothetical protein [Chthoniobacterales bacterium]
MTSPVRSSSEGVKACTKRMTSIQTERPMHTPTKTAVKPVRDQGILDADESVGNFPAVSELSDRIDILIESDRPRLRRLWMYFRNPLSIASAVIAGDDHAASGRPYRQAQEWGLPARITGVRAGIDPLHASTITDGPARKEVVIENDIGWRVETMVDYLFGKPLVITSAAVDPARRAA